MELVRRNDRHSEDRLRDEAPPRPRASEDDGRSQGRVHDDRPVRPDDRPRVQLVRRDDRRRDESPPRSGVTLCPDATRYHITMLRVVLCCVP